MNNSIEDKVEVLPTIGKPYDYKTWKNGRRHSKKELETEYSESIKTKGIYDAKKALLTAWNIVKHPKATEKQKNLAKTVIEQHNNYCLSLSCVSKIYAIARTLQRY